MRIPTFAINLKIREDRAQHIENEFKGRDEFQVTIVRAIEHQFGNVGLWLTIRQIIEENNIEDSDYILICEDDHLFTSDYSPDKLFNAIKEGQDNYADVLFGGVSWFEDGVQISDHLFSVKKFSGTQFTIVFRKFFKAILEAEFSTHDIADGKISSLSDSIFFINPFISVQKEFGYSDATEMNNSSKRVQSLFVSSGVKAKIASNVRKHYSQKFDIDAVLKSINIDEEWVIPTYVLNLPEREDRKRHILHQFDGKTEFDVQVVEAVKHEIGAFGHWQSFRKIIQLALDNDDDVMIICEDDHGFTEDYDKGKFLKDVYFAHLLGCDYLSGGSGKFDIAVPITEDLFWTSYCLSTQFIVVFKRFFQRILDAQFDENVIGDVMLSKLTESKMLVVPSISTQKDIGISDITALHNEKKGIVQDMFRHSHERLIYMQLIYSVYKSGTIKSHVQDSDIGIFPNVLG